MGPASGRNITPLVGAQGQTPRSIADKHPLLAAPRALGALGGCTVSGIAPPKRARSYAATCCAICEHRLHRSGRHKNPTRTPQHPTNPTGLHRTHEWHVPGTRDTEPTSKVVAVRPPHVVRHVVIRRPDCAICKGYDTTGNG